jgi:hypothetical protein
VPYIKADVKNVFGRKTECYCPKCDRLHNKWLDWKGRGTPRMFCPECNHVICNMRGGLDEGTEFHKHAISVGR